MRAARKPRGTASTLALSLALGTLTFSTDAALPERDTLRAWVEEMKASDRGPFARIRWFCKDGAVLPPEPFACQSHGGGSQHGEWTERVKQLRSEGYYIANFLADLDLQGRLANPSFKDELSQILIEQFLIRADDGWIIRKARYYRGAFQEEGERRGARQLLLELAGDPRWLDQGYAPLRVAARLLEHGPETRSVADVRQRSAALAKGDERFAQIRNKIHVRPERSDAVLVRKYADGVPDPDRAAEYHQLAALIESVYGSTSAAESLHQLADRARGDDGLQALARDGAQRLRATRDPDQRFHLSAELLGALRDRLPHTSGPGLRLAVLDTSLALEDEHFAAATELRDRIAGATRRTRLEWMRSSVSAIYGVGFLRERQLGALKASYERLQGTAIDLETYKGSLDYLALVPAWSAQRLRFHFFESMHRLAMLDPQADLFIQDQLRGSPLFFFAQVLDRSLNDANRMAGVQNVLLGEDVGSGLRALNPGLARGRLLVAGDADPGTLRSDGIYLLPETVSELPPVAGILTAGEGNPLSHVQLLARNLGIPNVAVDERLIPRLAAAQGREVVLAVSPAGSVRVAADLPRGDPWRGEETEVEGVLIEPDLDKLDLEGEEFVRLSDLRATDSGRIVGPKAAKLGELRHHYPEAVADGLAIPFGAFRRLLEQPYLDTGQTAFEWMVETYRRLDRISRSSPERKEATERFRLALQEWIVRADPGDRFRARLREAMQSAFGPEGTYGVFVRSDTNVEDLPGFTGAGLNLTVPNVVGFAPVLEAISRVWASPFSARAFAWRQSHMSQPEHVYPAVLLMRSVAADKSGVMVTQDIDTGDRGWLSIAVNEGVGGAVDGQAAESLRVNLERAQIKLLALATAPLRRRINPLGGVDKVPVSGSDTVLEPHEIGALIELARELPTRFPPIVDAAGNPAPADIEFGFLDGKLKLFQIRPFLESTRARSSQLLATLDRDLPDLGAITVQLDATTGTSP